MHRTDKTPKNQRLRFLPLLLAAILASGVFIMTGCEGNSRDRNEEARELEQSKASDEAGLGAESEALTSEEPDGNEAPEPSPYEDAEAGLLSDAEESTEQTDETVHNETVSAPSETPGEEADTEIADETEQREVLEKYRDLLQINPYVAGWLKIDDTVIDEPVVYTPGSQNYFLHRAIDGSDSKTGSLFIAINWQEDNNHTLIYGHNMKDGSAFGSLLKFADGNYGRSHHLIHFDTLYEEGDYELYGAFYSQIDEEDLETEEDRAQADKNIEESGIAKKAEEGEEVTAKELTLNDIDLHRTFEVKDIFRQEKDEDDGRFRYYYFTDLSNEDDFNYFAKSVKERSLYDMGIEAQWGDRFITLSTCSYQVKNGRFVVVGIKKR